MAHVLKKVNTAKRVLQNQGIGGITSVLIEDKLYNFKQWLKENTRWCVGKIIEIKGNTIFIDGCQFNVNNPAITTALKSQFYYNEYEAGERHALKYYLNPELPVIEFGAAMGVVACLTNKMLHHPEKHVVVEANPNIIPLLKDNRDRNDCQFTILHGAVAYGSDEITFSLYDDFLVGSAHNQSNKDGSRKTVTVQTVNLRQIADKFNFDKFTLICDIEGGEVDLVKFDQEVLRNRVATIILEVHEYIHGEEPIENMLLDLEKMNFRSAFERGHVRVLQKKND